MTSTTTLRAKVSLQWTQLKCWLVGLLVPRYLKRSILMCSLAAVISGANNKDYAVLAQSVTDELKLDHAYGTSAMISPMQWGSRIWSGLPPVDLEHEGRGRGLIELANATYASIPKSMIYSNRRSMRDDIFATIRATLRAQEQLHA